MIQKNLETWEEFMSYIEFAYNRSVDLATKFSPFKIVYGIDQPTPLPMDERINLNGKKKVDFVRHIHKKITDFVRHIHEKKANIVRHIHEKTWHNIQKRTE